jgi:hypothetical protein
MEKNANSPVWSVYDLFRTARLNVKYYSARVQQLERLHFAIELIIAISAPSSAIAGLWFWNTATGNIAWKTLAIVAAVAAVVKPLLMLQKKLAAYNEVLSAYRGLDQDLFQIKEMIAQRRKYDKKLQQDFIKALKRKGALATKDPEAKHSKRLIKKLMDEVNEELPADQFVVPC